MKIKELLKEIDGVFKPPIKKYYLGKQEHGTPYFFPYNYIPTIFRLVDTTSKYNFTTRTKWNINLGKYKLGIGTPIYIKNTGLGWKDKYNTPRFEWVPTFDIYFFGFQFRTSYHSPTEYEYNDVYWEMILWYLYYSNKDRTKAKKTWPWVNFETQKSTWDESLLFKILCL